MTSRHYVGIALRRRPSNNAVNGGLRTVILQYMEGLEKEIAAVGALIGYMACERRYHPDSLGEKISRCFIPDTSENPFVHEGPRLRLTSIKRRTS